MARLAKVFGSEVAIAAARVDAPGYSITVAQFAGGGTPPDGWAYYVDDVEVTDFAPMWVQPVGGASYGLGDIVSYSNKRWRSTIAGNVWEPTVTGWREADTDIPTWRQPLGAQDAYAKDAMVRFNAKVWKSLLPANVWQPPTNWRESALVLPNGTVAPPAWVQPTGAGDAYPLGAQVTHNTFVWRSDYAANVWEPGVFGWTRV